MSYFSLRKHEPDDEPEEEAEGAEEGGESVEDEASDSKAPAEPHGVVGALWAGISGPGRWLTARGRPGLAWLLYAGSAWAPGYYGSWVAVCVPLAWLLLVGLFAPHEALDRASGRLEGLFAPRPKAPANVAPGGEREAVRRLLLDVMGEADKVHLNTVLAHLQKHGQWEGKTVADLGVHLRALGVPVQPKVKVGGVPTRGVLRADLQAPSPLADTSPSPTPSPAV